jgi:hypothetical protein
MHPAPERMFCAHQLTYAYWFSRHSYSAIGAASVLTPGDAACVRGLRAASAVLLVSLASSGWECWPSISKAAMWIGFCSCPSAGVDLRGHDYLTGSTSNAGCLGATARIWSSLESGPVPSKKIPTSAFHLVR